jgi:outer membrane protein TolC
MNLKLRDVGRARSRLPALLVLLGVIAAALPLPAQESPPGTGGGGSLREPVQLTPDEAVSLAIKNNLNLKKVGVTVDMLKRKKDLSWNLFIPGVTVGGGLSKDNEKTDSISAPVELNPFFGSLPPGTPKVYGTTTVPYDVPQWHVVGQIEVSLQISAAMFEGLKTIKLGYITGQLGLENMKLQMEREIRKTYNQLLLIQEQVALLKESYAAAERQAAMAQANYRAGLAPELTLLQAQVSRENLRPQIDQAENGFKYAMARFADTLGFEYDTVFELVPVETVDLLRKSGGALPALDVLDLIRQASSNKPEIVMLRQELINLESQRKTTLLQNVTPALSLSWSGSTAFIKDPWKDSWFDSKDDWRNGGSLSIMLGWKLDSLLPFGGAFYNNKGGQGVKDVDANIQNKSIDIAAQIRSTEIEVYNSVLTLEKTRVSAETQQKTIDLAERTYRLTEQAYRAGLQDFLQVQNAELSLRQARVQMLEQQFNYLNGLIDLEYSIGAPFGTLSKPQGGNQ